MARATPGTWLRMLSQISREPAPPLAPVPQTQEPAPLLPQSQTTGAQPEPVRTPPSQPQSTSTQTTPVSMPTPQPEATTQAPMNPPLQESQTAPLGRQSTPQPQATGQPPVSQAFPQSQTEDSQPTPAKLPLPQPQDTISLPFPQPQTAVPPPPPERLPVPQAQDTMSSPLPQPQTGAPQPPTARPPTPQPREVLPLSQIAPPLSTPPARPPTPQPREILPLSQIAPPLSTPPARPSVPQPQETTQLPQSQEASEPLPRLQLVTPQPPPARLSVPQPQDTMQPQMITWPPVPQSKTSAPQPPIQTQSRPSSATRGTAPPSITVVVPEGQKTPEILDLASLSPPSESPRTTKTSFPTPALTTRQLQPIANLEYGTNQQDLQPKSISVQEEAINDPIKAQTPATATAKMRTEKEDKTAADARKGPRKTTEWKKEETEVTIITISGGNVGAHMELGSPPTQHHSHNSMKQQDGRPHRSGRDSEPHSLKGMSEVKQGKKSDQVVPNAKPIESTVNSNVQNINNSIFLNASCTVGNPGVHVTLFRNRTRPRKPAPSKKTSNDTSTAKQDY